jgi:hypothetical protein
MAGHRPARLGQPGGLRHVGGEHGVGEVGTADAGVVRGGQADQLAKQFLDQQLPCLRPLGSAPSRASSSESRLMRIQAVAGVASVTAAFGLLEHPSFLLVGACVVVVAVFVLLRVPEGRYQKYSWLFLAPLTILLVVCNVAGIVAVNVLT